MLEEIQKLFLEDAGKIFLRKILPITQHCRGSREVESRRVLGFKVNCENKYVNVCHSSTFH